MIEAFYAVSAPGLEPFTAQELYGLGLVPATGSPSPGGAVSIPPGGVAFSGDRRAIYRANLWLRTASRVLVRLGSFEAVGFTELRRRAARLEWERYLAPGQPVALRVTCHKSRLYHSDAVAQRVVAAIGDRLGKPLPLLKYKDDDVGKPPQLVLVRLWHDQVTVSLDSSGELLHRRGYRLETARAPLRETLAAGLVLASGWDRSAPLIDPFCGSGAIPIEAALMRNGLPPGRGRAFAFMDWPGFDRTLWESLLTEAREQVKKPVADILASDRDAGAVQAAQANARRAGMSDEIHFDCQSVTAAIANLPPLEGPGWVVTNPPYGLRVSAGQDLRNLYAQFGKVLRAHCPGWHLALLCADERAARHIGIPLDMGLSLVNGGVSVRMGCGVVPG